MVTQVEQNYRGPFQGHQLRPFLHVSLCAVFHGTVHFLSESDVSVIFPFVAARVLATYLIPGCVGRGVRLGSENSSGAGAAGAGGVWKSGAIFLEKKRRLRQRTHKFRASKNMRTIFLEKKKRLRQRSQPLGASKKSKK